MTQFVELLRVKHGAKQYMIKWNSRKSHAYDLGEFNNNTMCILHYTRLRVECTGPNYNISKLRIMSTCNENPQPPWDVKTRHTIF